MKEPFAVINADDYYGRECFRLLADFLSKPGADAKKHIAMAGYILENTLTENGYVSRGICTVEPDGTLTDLVERTHIEIREGVSQFTEDDGATWETLPAGCYVSMNCWAFPARIPGLLRGQVPGLPEGKGRPAESGILPALRGQRHGGGGRG